MLPYPLPMGELRVTELQNHHVVSSELLYQHLQGGIGSSSQLKQSTVDCAAEITNICYSSEV